MYKIDNSRWITPGWWRSLIQSMTTRYLWFVENDVIVREIHAIFVEVFLHLLMCSTHLLKRYVFSWQKSFHFLLLTGNNSGIFGTVLSEFLLPSFTSSFWWLELTQPKIDIETELILGKSLIKKSRPLIQTIEDYREGLNFQYQKVIQSQELRV